MRRYLILDYETKSLAPLRGKLGVGAAEYASHPSTRVLCASWRLARFRNDLRDRAPKIWRGWEDEAPPAELADALSDPDTRVIAHNAFFERMITWKVLKTRVPIERWECTAARAAALALPRALENLCEALKLDTKKNPDGKRLIRKYCQPRKPTFTNTSLWNDDEEGLEALAQYCADDVRAETEVYLTLPPLPPLEKKVWVLDQRINSRGVYCDRPLVKTVLKMVREELAELQRETIELTDGRVENTTKRAECLVWLEEQGLVLPNFQAKTVADAIETGLATGPARKLLEIRQAVSKTSTAKYLAFEKRTRTDSRLRDLLLYHGASTGRWSGVGVQPQNFPRPKIENVPDAIRAVRQGDLEWVRAMHGPPMEVFASCLRGVLRATPGRRLYCADYSAIEARVLFWIAKHDAGLRAFEQDRDLYREMATKIFTKHLDDVTDPDREIGKRAILGCGYGMGDRKFAETCKTFGQVVSDKLAKTAVQVYRTAHAPVPKLWSNLERAAIAATREKGKRFSINRTKWFVEGRFLYCELPSGRRLAYYGPTIRMGKTPWGEERPVLYHWGVHPKNNKKWVEQGTYGGKLCIAKGTLVLTRTSWVPIESVLPGTDIWDGVAWATCAGAICNGLKEVINAYGARMTPDHRVLTTSGWVNASQSEKHSRFPCRLPSGHSLPRVKREEISLGSPLRLRSDENHRRVRTSEDEKTEYPGVLRVPETPNHKRKADRARNVPAPRLRGMAVDDRSMPPPFASILEKLWRAGHTVFEEMGEIFSTFLERYEAGLSTRALNRPDQQQQPGVQQEKLPMGYAPGTSEQSENVIEVYDLVNCGPLKRFTILADGEPLIVHNCENVVQAVARDLMAEAMLRTEAAGYDTLITVHDEILSESENGSLDQFNNLMAEVPEWGAGCPVRVKGWTGVRYRK